MTYLKRLPVLLALLATLGSAATASALTPLPEERHINLSLMAGVVGDEIRKNCPSISARMFVAWQKLEGLKRYALEQGYDEDAIRAFIKDPEEKARVKAMAADYMAARGVVPGNAESYCALGRAEIAKGSLIGSMLRAK